MIISGKSGTEISSVKLGLLHLNLTLQRLTRV